MLDNQTPEFFQDVNKPKYNGTLNLDRWAPPFSSPSVSLHGPHTGVRRPGHGPLLGSDQGSPLALPEVRMSTGPADPSGAPQQEPHPPGV